MTAPKWWDGKISPGNVISWLLTSGGVVAVFVWIQADVKALQEWKLESRSKIDRLESQRASDRETLMEIKGDIRVIRQMLEQRTPR
jgi:hypothetical protein